LTHVLIQNGQLMSKHRQRIIPRLQAWWAGAAYRPQIPEAWSARLSAVLCGFDAQSQQEEPSSGLKPFNFTRVQAPPVIAFAKWQPPHGSYAEHLKDTGVVCSPSSFILLARVLTGLILTC
jgi:hypothetical protein